MPERKRMALCRPIFPAPSPITRPATMMAFLATIGCNEPPSSNDEGPDSETAPLSHESLGLPKGVCVDARHPESEFFENLRFTGQGDPYMGINFSQLAALKIALQTARAPTWEIGGAVPPHGINIEGFFNGGNVSGSFAEGDTMNQVVIPGINNNYAGLLIALDLEITQLNGHWTLELRDSIDPEFEDNGTARFHLHDGPMVLHGLPLDPLSDERIALEERREDTSWAMEGCRDLFTEGILDDWLLKETGL